MTDHDPDTCGHNHNHQPNPYTDPPHQLAYTEFVMQLFRLSCVSVAVSVQLTIAYAGVAATGMAPAGHHDAITTYRALLWELARLACDLSENRPLQFEVSDTPACNDPSHNHEPDDPDSQFGAELLKAFFTAAGEGNLEGAVQVGNAAARQANDENGHEPSGYVIGLFANAMASLCYTTYRQNDFPPSYLYEK